VTNAQWAILIGVSLPLACGLPICIGIATDRFWLAASGMAAIVLLVVAVIVVAFIVAGQNPPPTCDHVSFSCIVSSK
jgi:hypothetical protein